MANLGLARGSHGLDDLRQFIIVPTSKGHAVSEDARKKAEAILDEIVARFTVEEKHALKRGLELLRSAVERTPGSR